jgi:hypothetical protein
MADWRQTIRSWTPATGLNHHQRILLGAAVPFVLGVLGALTWTAVATTQSDRLALLWKAAVIASVGYLCVRQLHLRWLLGRRAAAVSIARKVAVAAEAEARAARNELAEVRQEASAATANVAALRAELAQVAEDVAAARKAAATALFTQAAELMTQPPRPRVTEHGRPRNHLRLAPDKED